MAVASLPQSTWYSGGAIAAAGTLNVYQTGTTTLVTCYSDGALTVPISNPITLDSNGQASFYVGTAVALKLQSYTSAAVLIETLDPVYTTNDFSGFSGTGADLQKIAGITNGTAANNKALVLDGSGNISGLNTPTANTASTNAANMLAVQNSQIGGFANKFRNPVMDIPQRGASGTITAGTPSITLDGWYVGCTGANVTWGRTAGSSIGYPQVTWSLNVLGATSVTDAFVKQRIEGAVAAPLTSVQVTVQAQFYNISGTTITPTLTVKHATALDNWSATATDVNGVNLQSCANNALTQLAYTFAGSSAAINGLEITFDFGNNWNSGSKQFDITAFDIRATPGVSTGINSNPPIPELRQIPVEYPINRRYLQARVSGGTTDTIASGMCNATTTALIVIPFDVPMRTSPTGITVSNATHFSLKKSDGTLQACTAIAFNQSSIYALEVLATVASGLTAGNATELIFNNASGSLIATGAEL